MTTGACLLATLLAQSAAAHAEPAPSPAHADVELPRIAILVGAGMRQIWLRNDHVYPASQKADAIGLVTMVGVRVSPRVALGVHVGASQTGDSMEFRGNTTSESSSWSVTAIDLAIAAQYEDGRFTVTPWIGRHVSRLHREDGACVYHRSVGDRSCSSSQVTDWTNDFTSYGLTTTVTPNRTVPIVVFVDLQTGTGGAILGPYAALRYHESAVTLGFAYRR